MKNSNKGATVEEIKDRSNIVDVIGRVVNLKKAGINYKGLCPFHNEKTPSFVVSDTKQRYTCFGCNKSGDVINFMQEYYNMDFVQAVEKLADECGLEFKPNYTGENKNNDELYEINRQAARFFYKALREQQNPGLPYMMERGLSAETMKTFGIGWADGQWDSLYKYMKNLGYSDEKLLEAGLISKSNGKCFDKFRERVIFPIQNTSGKVIGFGGRAMGDAMPKYLNSQETSVFKKKNNLYGLNITRNEINKADRAILVEGYMDVIGLYQAGVKNVSASLGTALTDSQARMLKRYTKNVLLAYDGDAAGINAALRGMDILKAEGCRVNVLRITDGKDPDEFVKKHGKEAFLKIAEEASPYAKFKLDIARESFDMTRTEGRVDYLKAAAGILAGLSPVEADMYIKIVAAENDISQGALRAEVERLGSGEKRKREEEGQVNMPMTSTEKTLLKILITDSSYIDKDVEYNKMFKTPTSKGIFKAIKGVHIPGQEIDINKLEDNMEEEDVRSLEEIRDGVKLAGRTEKIFEDCVFELQREELKRRERELLANLEMLESVENEKVAGELMKELNEIQRKLNVRGK